MRVFGNPYEIGKDENLHHFMMTTVHNKYKENYDIYIGRPTIFGNPYEIGKDGNREEVVKKYREYFNNRIQSDKGFLKQVLTLKGKRLGCFCKPNECHGDVICEFLTDVS